MDKKEIYQKFMTRINFCVPANYVVKKNGKINQTVNTLLEGDQVHFSVGNWQFVGINLFSISV